jgi:hypothetical protein
MQHEYAPHMVGILNWYPSSSSYRGMIARRAAIAFACLTIAAVLWLPEAWAVVTPVKVLAAPASQFLPFSNDAYLAYTQNSLAHPHRYNVYVHRYSDSHTRRINATGTQATSGNFDPGTNKLIYEQYGTDWSNLYVYNLDTNRRTPLRALNTGRYSTDPRISTAFISYVRYFKTNGRWYGRLLLVDRTTGHARSLMTQRATATHWMNNGTVGERFATWNACSGSLSDLGRCAVHVYDAVGRTVQKIPTVNGRPQYGGAVDEFNGLVFYARAGLSCGRGVTFYELPVSALKSTPIKLGSLPRGSDLDFSASVTLNSNTNAFDYFFERFVCGRHGSGEIYSLRGVSPGPE